MPDQIRLGHRRRLPGDAHPTVQVGPPPITGVGVAARSAAAQVGAAFGVDRPAHRRPTAERYIAAARRAGTGAAYLVALAVTVLLAVMVLGALVAACRLVWSYALGGV